MCVSAALNSSGADQSQQVYNVSQLIELTVQGREPDVTHWTSWPESTVECVWQLKAADQSLPQRKDNITVTQQVYVSWHLVQALTLYNGQQVEYTHCLGFGCRGLVCGVFAVFHCSPSPDCTGREL